MFELKGHDIIIKRVKSGLSHLTEHPYLAMTQTQHATGFDTTLTAREYTSFSYNQKRFLHKA